MLNVRHEQSRMGRLEEKVALISGGARGQGATEARLFATEGAKVVLGDVLDDAGKQVAEDIRRAGGEATYIHLDVTEEEDWEQAVAAAESNYDPSWQTGYAGRDRLWCVVPGL